MRSSLKNVEAIVAAAIVLNIILLQFGDQDSSSSCAEEAFRQIQQLRDMEDIQEETPSNEKEVNRTILVNETWRNRRNRQY